MSRREKLLQKMRTAPDTVRFGEVNALLRHEGFVLFNRRGSHCTYHRGRPAADHRFLHGHRKTCHPADIRKLLELLDQ